MQYLPLSILIDIYADLSVRCFECCTLQFKTLIRTQTINEYQNINVEPTYFQNVDASGLFYY